MRGGFVHNCILLQALAGEIISVGGQVTFEVAVRVTGGVGFIDLVAQHVGRCIAVEAEMSSRRIGGDIAKAAALGADALWVVVPNSRVARAVRRQLLRIKNGAARPAVSVHTLGQARQRVRSCFSLNSGANAGGKEEKTDMRTGD